MLVKELVMKLMTTPMDAELNPLLAELLRPELKRLVKEQAPVKASGTNKDGNPRKKAGMILTTAGKWRKAPPPRSQEAIAKQKLTMKKKAQAKKLAEIQAKAKAAQAKQIKERAAQVAAKRGGFAPSPLIKD